MPFPSLFAEHIILYWKEPMTMSLNPRVPEQPQPYYKAAIFFSDMAGSIPILSINQMLQSLLYKRNKF